MFLDKNMLATVPLALVWSGITSAAPSGQRGSAVKCTTCNGETYMYEELAGYGYLPSNGRDETGDTLGGIGSSIAMDIKSWRKEGKSYKGLMYCLPDRGWNTQGTLNYQNRIQRLEITFTPEESATVSNPAEANLDLKYLDTILLTDPSGTPTTGLNPDAKGPYLTFPDIPFHLPSVNYVGNGFGGKGSSGQRISFDSEGLFLGRDGTFWVSDEYGPYVYHFDHTGEMIGAIRPPDAIIPRRNGSDSFSSDDAPIYDEDLLPIPEENPTGRNNNQGFEGLTTNPEGTTLYVLLQSATNQDGGLEDGANANTRFLVYDISVPQPTLEAEYVVTLPHVDPSDSDSDVAAQSEIHYISDTQFLVLARDSDAGRGQDETESMYRHIDIFDISEATNIKGEADCYKCNIATKKGKLLSNVKAAEYCSWLDFNVNSQLRRFGVHNGGASNRGLLNEKWESIALVPVDPEAEHCTGGAQEYYLFSFSDNDFITQDGYMNSGRLQYQDESGYNLLNQALVFKVKLPGGAKPLLG
ncbi:hypothetical protein LTR37_002162 [Vermiconidia calcicola]|uniref:Uncharacterized protein n=1 Tax=Vermiconidia calcicola TaxID=1690605 RepID=A0ACC3NWM3_9PEZI|nr:hypothetical protein LTR37_002162 [Vermiconidia calcicola]